MMISFISTATIEDALGPTTRNMFSINCLVEMIAVGLWNFHMLRKDSGLCALMAGVENLRKRTI